MANYILRRLALMIPTLIGVSFLVFLLTRLTPGDPVRMIVGPDAPQERVDEVRRDLGLDRPVIDQYIRFMGGALQGDLGQSLRTRQPVMTELATRFPLTLQLTILAVSIAVVIGIPLGVASATRKDTSLDKAATVIALFGASMPLFWIAIMGILFFSVKLGWLPTAGNDGPIWTWAGLRSFILPAVTLALSPIALIMRLTRSSMLEVLNREYVTVARAKGLIESKVVVRHALRNALLPVITFVALVFGALLGGAVVTETIFSLPGLGRLVVTAINQRDYPIIQGAVLMLAVVFSLINFAVDILYAFLDPRIRYD
ncbi:MAG TPA: ABC transporter permease [Thermomicrobiales bacterium]|nr:ABC transporter permease [Thermomicrobiales bacterium]